MASRMIAQRTRKQGARTRNVRARVWRVLACFLLLAFLIPSPGLVRADIIPTWTAPAQLIPGITEHGVRLATQTIDVEILERGVEVVARVRAHYELFNDGDPLNLPVGYATLLHEGGFFNPAQGMLRATFLGQPLAEPTRGELDLTWAQGGCICPWDFWTLHLTNGGPQILDVEYDLPLKLDWFAPGADVAYRLLTYDFRLIGRWHGVPTSLVVIVDASSGGRLFDDARLFHRPPIWQDGQFTRPAVLPDEPHRPERATDATPHRVVWQYRDVVPDWELGATYLRRAPWERLQATEEAIQRDDATAADYLEGVAAIHDLIGYLSYLTPAPFMEGYADRARLWAWRATELSPDSAEAWEAVGWMEFWYVGWWHGLACWPTDGARAMQRSADLGSARAAEYLTYVEPWIVERVYGPRTMLPPCEGEPDPTLLKHRQSDKVYRNVVSVALDARIRALSGDDRSWLGDVYAGAALDAVTDEADGLLALGQRRRLSVGPSRVERVYVDDVSSVRLLVRYTVDTDTLQDASGRVLRQTLDRRHHEEWRLTVVHHTWRVTEIQEAPP